MVRYGEDIIEIKVKDSTGRTIDKMAFNAADGVQGTKILRFLKDKYGISSKDKIDWLSTEGVW